MDHVDLSLNETPGDGVRQALQRLDERLQCVEANVAALRRQLDQTLSTILRPAEDLPGSETEPGDGASSMISADRQSEGAPNGDSQGAEPIQADESPESTRDGAMRYARVLVSEIELYNPAEVAQGRHSRDLYSRLRPQIERGRKAYDRRFGAAANLEADYFHEELVRALAKGDAGCLGPGDPNNSK